METSARITAWLRDVAVARADRTVEVPGGVIVLHSDFPMAHDHNRMLLWSDVDAATAAAAADDVLGGAGLEHRLIEVSNLAVADSMTAGLQALGYSRSDDLVMTYGAAQPQPAPDVAVVELDLARRAAVAEAGWKVEQPGWQPAVSHQLGERIATIIPVVEATFLAVLDGGLPAARTDVYLRDGVAQIEEVVTDPAVRRQGFASALVLTGVQRAQAAGASVIFLIVDVDGPTDLYRRLGFADQFRMASFSR